MAGSNLCVRIWSSVSLYILGEAFQLRNCMFSSCIVQSLSHAVIHILWLFLCCHLRFQTVDYSDMLEWTAEIEFHKSLPHAVIQCTPTRWLFLRVRMDGKDWFCTHFTLWPYLPYHVFYFDLMVQKGWEYRILGIIIYTHSRD